VLLLGQSESGKSTTLKNFQLLYDPKAFKAERSSWRTIIRLNVVRSIHFVLDILDRAEHEAGPSSSHGPSSDHPQFSHELLLLRKRLVPILQIEKALIERLGPFGPAITLDYDSSYLDRSKHMTKEVAINCSAWTGAINRLLGGEESQDTYSHEHPTDWNDPKDPSVVLNFCAQDMALLWNDPTVKQLLKKQGVRLEEMAGFFLDSLDRITALDYVPSDDDVLRARLKTLGVSEHHFKISPDYHAIARDWRIFDVGGHRSLRAAWVPYFDDMDAIILLAPISAFDQNLAEDRSVNRLEDSVNIWKYIVSNKLLKDTSLILFLNKVDLLKAKLESGIKFSQYVVSYGNRPNDFENTSNYLRKKFSGVLKEKSIVPRPFYCHLTSVTNIESTTAILGNVRDVIMRRALSEATLIS